MPDLTVEEWHSRINNPATNYDVEDFAVARLTGRGLPPTTAFVFYADHIETDVHVEYMLRMTDETLIELHNVLGPLVASILEDLDP